MKCKCGSEDFCATVKIDALAEIDNNANVIVDQNTSYSEKIVELRCCECGHDVTDIIRSWNWK